MSRHAVPIEPWYDSSALLEACSAPAIQLLRELLDAYPEVPLTAPPGRAGGYEPLPTAADRSVPNERSAREVPNRSRAVWWTSPLTIVVSKRTWDRQESVTCLVDGTADSVTVALGHPLVLDDVDRGSPGTVQPTVGGGAVVSCNPGAVFFQLAESIG